MKRKLILILALLLFIGCQSSIQKKYLVILQAGIESHEGMARAVHALLYSTEMKEAGFDVVLVFDGAGTEWARALLNPDHKLHRSYKKLESLGVTQIICDFCSGAFKVKKDLIDGAVPLVGDYSGHPSIVKWLKKGYTPIIL